MRARFHRFTLVDLVIVVVVLFVLASMLGRPRMADEKARRMNCAGNLKQIGLAMIMYAGDDVDGGYFPSGTGTDLGLLHIEKYLVNGKIYGCPSKDNPSQTASASDYTYVGAGLQDTNKSAKTVRLAYDESGNHPDNGWCNVLYIDGHVTGAKPQ